MAYDKGRLMQEEHKELTKDIGHLFLNFTPLSGPIATYNFLKKWYFERQHRKANEGLTKDVL